MAIRAQQPPPEQQQTAYLPPGPDPLVFDRFEGINTSTTRPGVRDEQMAWSDSMLQIGPRDLRTLYDIGDALWGIGSSAEPVGTTIVLFDFANIGTSPIAVAILSNGSIYHINTTTGLGNRFAAPGTIINPSRLTVGMTQYGNQYVLIVAQQTNGYFVWDGTTFYQPGETWPPGGTIPTAIGGTSIETYAGRIWIADGATIIFSAPGSVNDFTTGSGGGEFTSSDSFLRVEFTQLKQSNGFLYLIGDSSINYISGVQTSGDPLVTTFTNQNADPEVGTPWPGTVDTFGRNILFANAFGAHVSYGAAVTKISEQLDGVYNTVPNFGGFIPSAAKAIIFGKKVWILLLPIIDPRSGQQVNKLFLWDTKRWFPASQSVSLVLIQHQEISSILTAWGTDSDSIYPLFQTPSADLEKVAQSRLWDTPIGLQVTKAITRLWGMVLYYDFNTPAVTIDLDNETPVSATSVVSNPPVMTWTYSGGTMSWTHTGGGVLTWFTSGGGQISVFGPMEVGQVGILNGLTFRTNSPDLSLISLMMQPEIVQGRY